MSIAFLVVIPLISARRSGSSSIILKVSSPNLSTILSASTAPRPFIAPEPKYFFDDNSSVAGTIL